MKYEYKTETRFNFDNLEPLLNKEGQSSWELAWVQNLQGSSLKLYFKRAIREHTSTLGPGT